MTLRSDYGKNFHAGAMQSRHALRFGIAKKLTAIHARRCVVDYKKFISIGANPNDARTLSDLQLEVRRLERIVQDLRLERDVWKDVAKGLYDYYYLGEGSSKVVREYEEKSNE